PAAGSERNDEQVIAAAVGDDQVLAALDGDHLLGPGGLDAGAAILVDGGIGDRDGAGGSRRVSELVIALVAEVEGGRARAVARDRQGDALVGAAILRK